MTNNSQKKQWTVEEFQAVANELLSTHYGIGVNDTMLWDNDIVEAVIAAGHQPFQIVQEHAEEANLDRIDNQSWTGHAYPPLTEQDQLAATARILDAQGLPEKSETRPLGPKF
jgi:hypothetical protein